MHHHQLSNLQTLTPQLLLGPSLPPQVGAELGVGMCENIVRGTNWRLFAKTATSWFFTLIVTALLSAAFFAQGEGECVNV